MSASKNCALRHRLAFVARAASECRLLSGHRGFPPSNARIIVRLEKEGLIVRRREYGGPLNNRTIFVATTKGRKAIAAAGIEPTGNMPGSSLTGELYQNRQSRKAHKVLVTAFDPVIQAAHRKERARRRAAILKAEASYHRN